MNEDILKTEEETYLKNKIDLLATKAGRFVLIKGEQIVDDFASFEDAVKIGYSKFGNEPFFVKQIVEIENINYFTRDILVAA